ncbi:unnamed protein product [Urochloa humidicola]
MPPAPEEKQPPLPPLPRPKPPKPKHKPKTGPEPRPRPESSEHYWTPGPGGAAGTLPPDPIACAGSCVGTCFLLPHCSQQPPSSPAATVHISSGRLPTPLIALSASLLAVSAVLLLALLVHRLARRRRRRRNAAALAAAHHDPEGGHVLAGAAAAAAGGEDEEEVDADGGGGVHHVWYIRTKGLDERAIAAIAAVVYDAGSKKQSGGAGADDGGSCAVCLAEFRHGETLRLLPRCGHAFHRGCIDTWLRAHVNCPLCRAPVQVPAGGDPDAAAVAAPERNPRGVHQPEEAERGGGGALPAAERGVRRAASMVALPRRGGAWPPEASFRAPASSSGREGDMAAGLGKIMRLLKFSDSLELAGVGAGAGAGRSVSFGAGICQRLPERSEPSAAGVGVSSDEMPQ